MITILEPELALIRRIAQATSRRFYGFVEVDDVFQELALWICVHYAKVLGWREQHDGVNTPPLARALGRRATTYARKEQAAWRRSMPRDAAPLEEYDVEQVRAALPLAMSVDTEEVNLGPTAQAVVADIKAGLETLRWADQGVIQAAVDYDYDYGAIAEAYTDDEVTLTSEAARKRVFRALTRLARAMNQGPQDDDEAKLRRWQNEQYNTVARRVDADTLRRLTE